MAILKKNNQYYITTINLNNTKSMQHFQTEKNVSICYSVWLKELI
jgi:hypothetical protein